MAQDLALIAHGEPQWDTKVNAVIEKVNANANMAWTQMSKDGIVFQNGFMDRGSSGYQYIQFNGWKLVHLKVSVKMITDNSNKQELVVVTVPDAISFPDYSEWMENPKYRWSADSNSARLSADNNAGWWVGEDSHYFANFLYPHFD